MPTHQLLQDPYIYTGGRSPDATTPGATLKNQSKGQTSISGEVKRKVLTNTPPKCFTPLKFSFFFRCKNYTLSFRDRTFFREFMLLQLFDRC